MTNLKWADVAHMYMYVEHEVLVSHSTSVDPLRRVSGAGEDLGIYYHRADLVRDGFKTVPILRHRNDMTEAEALRIFKIVHGDDGGEYSAPNALIWFKRCIDDRGMSPNFMYGCISLGFDVFGLIESGEAIRKEKTA